MLDGLETAIRQAIVDGSNVFISGMARGVDIWAAEIVLQIRSEGEDIKLICASPYRGFEKNWSINWQRRYNNVIEAADLVRFICPNYSKSCFQIRNEWMVDHSSRVIAVFYGQLGGTKNTIDYAKIRLLIVSGSFSTNSHAQAIFKASIISSSVASSLTIRIFSAIVPERIVFP